MSHCGRDRVIAAAGWESQTRKDPLPTPSAQTPAVRQETHYHLPLRRLLFVAALSVMFLPVGSGAKIWLPANFEQPIAFVPVAELSANERTATLTFKAVGVASCKRGTVAEVGVRLIQPDRSAAEIGHWISARGIVTPLTFEVHAVRGGAASEAGTRSRHRSAAPPAKRPNH